MSESQDPSDFDGRTSNAETRARWRIDPDLQPGDVPLETLDPGNGDWFEQGKALEVMRRLREEAPVHYIEESQFGPYWSLTLFDDVKYTDTHHHQFSSDIMNGGIRLGGRPLDEPPPEMFHLPMFIMQDQPVHDDQRKVVAPMFTPTRLAAMGELIRQRAADILYTALRIGDSFLELLEAQDRVKVRLKPPR